jgi:hypothetical protein
MLKLSLPTTDEFFAAGRWELQLKPTRQQTLKTSPAEDANIFNIFVFSNLRKQVFPLKPAVSFRRA